MTENHHESLRKSARWLRGFAGVARVGCGIVGLSLFGSQLLKLGESLIATWGGRVEAGVWALVYLAGYGIFGQVAYTVLRLLADLLDAWIDNAEAHVRLLTLVQDRLAPAVEKLVEASQKAPVSTPAGRPGPAKQADLSALSINELLVQLRSAKKAGDADAVLDLFEHLKPRVKGERHDRLVTDVITWASHHFQSILRKGQATLVANSLGRAVSLFKGFKSAEHLADVLPIVRQSVGLCPKCGRPYRGTADQCPLCEEEPQNGAHDE